MKAKILNTVLLMILISSLFVACGQARGICDICGKNAKLWEVTVNESTDFGKCPIDLGKGLTHNQDFRK